MLQESKIYTFLSGKYNLTVHFLEGQKMIQEIVLTQSLNANILPFLREGILGFQPLAHFLKQGESFGIYIENNSPEFSFKIESTYTGRMRSLLLPHNFSQFPHKLQGYCRLHKFLPNRGSPYESIIPTTDRTLSEVFNDILKNSYQINAQVFISDLSDQSLMLTKLPAFKENSSTAESQITLAEFFMLMKKDFLTIFAQGLNEEAKIIEAFKKIGLEYLASKPTEFSCWCSQERMVAGLATLSQETLDELYLKDKIIEVNCDYCQKKYQFTRDQVDKALQ